MVHTYFIVFYMKTCMGLYNFKGLGWRGYEVVLICCYGDYYSYKKMCIHRGCHLTHTHNLDTFRCVQEASGERRHDVFCYDVQNRLQTPLISTHSVKVNHTFFICITIPITILGVLIHSFCFFTSIFVFSGNF